MAALWAVNTASLKPVMWLHSTMWPSEPPDTMVGPSGEQSTALTSWLWIW
jgi:hypothetical protein